jgi:hypothetical protein
MRFLLLFSTAALMLLTPAARAQVIVQTPWVNVQVCPTEVMVQAGPFAIRVPRARRAAPAPVMPEAFSLEPAPGEPPPVPIDPGSGTGMPPSLAAFAAAFRPQAGHHEAVLLHPATGQPVKVGFTLPDGEPRKVRVLRYRVAFDYGRKTIALIFRRDGTVQVRP